MWRTSRALLDLLLPPGPCALCGGDSKSGFAVGLCRTCWRERKRLVEPRCTLCGTPIQSGVGEPGHPCGRCLAEPPAFQRHLSPYAYDGPARHLLLAYKDGGRYPLARLLGRAVGREVRRGMGEISLDGVTFVPSTLWRRMGRGFEPAQLLARETARFAGLPLSSTLRMRKSPRPQKGLTAAQRRENLSGVFAARAPLQGQTLLLVDDVYTTGATLRAASAALARAGATVYAATFAMTLRREMDLYGADEGRETTDESVVGGPPSAVGS